MPQTPNNKLKPRTGRSPALKPINYVEINTMLRKYWNNPPKSTRDEYWEDEHRAKVLKAFIPSGSLKRVYGRPIAMVRGTTLGIPDGKTFGSVEPRKVEGVEEMVRASFKQEEQAIMLWDATDDKKAEALRLAKQAFENTVTTSEIWSSHPESGDPSTRYSTVVDAGGKPWLTFRWWSALGEGNPAYYFDIVERASNKVLKPPKDLQILNVWAEHMDVLPTMEQIHANASAQNFIENRKVIWVPSPIPDSADERYRAAAGSIVVVLCDYQVVGHVQVPVVVV